MSISVSHMTVYVGSVSSNSCIYALQASDGALIWNYQLDTDVSGNSLSVLALSEQAVYVAVLFPAMKQRNTPLRSFLYALQRSNGSLLWRRELSRASSRRASSPVYADRNLYFCTPEGVYAVQAETGLQQWFSPLPHLAAIRPVIMGERLYVRAIAGSIYALRARDGALLWRFDAGGEAPANLTVTEDYVCVRGDGGLISLLKAADGSVLWQRQTGYFSLFDPTMTEEIVCFNSSKGLQTWRTADGAALWQFSTKLPCVSSPLPVEGALYASAGEGTRFAVYALRRLDGSLLWQWEIDAGAGGITSPVGANGTLYVNVDGKGLYALNRHDGSVLWHALDGRHLSKPVVG